MSFAPEVSAGETVLPRFAFASTNALVSGAMRLSYFTAGRSETIGSLVAATGATAAAATPTLCRMGIYAIASDGAGTLVASTANDTALFSAANTIYTKALSASLAKVAGQRYAFAILVVSGTTMPNFVSTSNSSILAAENAVEPRITASLAGQADLPASFASGSLAAVGPALYGRLVV